MKCCGEDRQSAYCPDCGKQILGEDSLIGLMRHIIKTVRGIKTTIKECDPARTRRIELLNRTVRKWQAWQRQLAVLMERPQDIPRED